MSTFKDELNQNTKTPTQVLNEQWNAEKENIISIATSDYDYIKRKLLDKAKSGQYLSLGDKKLISMDYKSDYVSKSIQRVDKSTSTPKIFGKGNYIFGHVEYTFKNQKAYDFYMETLQNLCNQDDINITPIFTSEALSQKRNVTLPYVYTGEYNLMSKVHACLQCSIEY